MEISMLLIFIFGYLGIVFEHKLKIDKAAVAMFIGVVLWSLVVIFSTNKMDTSHLFLHNVLPDIASIIFFLMGAMTIVEMIDLHEGFHIITNKITTTNKRKLIWIISIISFFLSAVLDNLTTAIVMISILKKLIDDKEERMFFAGMVIIAANAGGAWSPLGDITTTMLWIGGQVSTFPLIKELFLPSLVCLLVPLIAVSFQLKGNFDKKTDTEDYQNPYWIRCTVLFIGIGILLFVPIFKTITHLPPFMGMFLGVAILWIITDLIHKEKDDYEKKEVSIFKALSKIDIPSTLFFFGILSAIAALEHVGFLHKLAVQMDSTIGNKNVIIYCIGLLSAIIDNVPLVAATQGMYNLETIPMDSHFWHLIAFCAGTGGSILIIGSAAGVAIMGIEKIEFGWYAKKIGWLAFIGYTAGAIVSIIESLYF